MKIIIDGYGGDNSPQEIIKGCVLAVKEIADLNLVVTGKKIEIEKFLKELGYTGDKIEIVNAESVISCDDENPAKLIKSMPNSSIVVAFETLKQRDDIDALISAGSTGAVLAGAILKIGRIKGVSRPGLAPTLPTKIEDKGVLLVDCGANADCKPINLCHFAAMGSVYYEMIYGIKNPRVALLNVGTEDAKGNLMIKESFKLMKEMPINFVGNLEARDALSGDYEVIVADGFSGNLALKSIEGAVSLVMSNLKKEIKASFSAKIGYLFMKKAFNKLKNRFDYTKYGGSQFLGCKKPIFKAHGNSKAESIVTVIKQAMSVANSNLNQKIEELVNSLDIKAD